MLLVLAGVTGMLGAASVDLGPFASVEQTMLAEAVPASARNLAFGRYSLTAGLLNAAGAAAAALASTGSTPSFFFVYQRPEATLYQGFRHRPAEHER